MKSVKVKLCEVSCPVPKFCAEIPIISISQNFVAKFGFVTQNFSNEIFQCLGTVHCVFQQPLGLKFKTELS